MTTLRPPPPRAAATPVAASALSSHVPLALVLTAVALQIAYPLTHGTVRDGLTVAVVITLAAACVAHAAVTRGTATAVALVLVTVVPGFAIEAIGVASGVPFGRYEYGTSLGPRFAGVPLVIALAWTMLAWPAALVARRLVAGFPARVAVGAWGVAGADLFLDPQQVAAGQWHWARPSPHLPGVGTVPLTNYAGWLVVALVLSTALQCVLDRVPRSRAGEDTLAIGLYLWLYAGWVVALAAFLDLPWAALWGGVGMGSVALPLAGTLRPRIR